jgi:hypothetical protein
LYFSIDLWYNPISETKEKRKTMEFEIEVVANSSSPTAEKLDTMKNQKGAKNERKTSSR